MEPLQGSCLCGGVRFEITASFLNANHCHCSRCRKHSGTFGETQGRVPREGFRLISGEQLIRFAGKHQNRVVMTILAPGLWLQRLTTREPTLDQLEVSIRALREVLRLEGGMTPEERRVEVMA